MKKPRLHEVAKQIGVKATDLVNILREKGMQISMNSAVEDVEEIKEIFEEHQKAKKEETEKNEKLAKGVFVGIVYDLDTKRFHRMKLVGNLSEIIKGDVDVVDLGEHTSIFGAKIELAKDLQKNILTDPRDYE